MVRGCSIDQDIDYWNHMTTIQARDETMPGHEAPSHGEILNAAGLAPDAVSEWQQALPKCTASYAADRHAYADFWLRSARLVERLPPPRRSDRERAAAAMIAETAR